MVVFCVQHADDDESLPTLARHAATALAKEPVLAGAIMLLARRPGTAYAARRLWAAAPGENGDPLALLWGFASDHETAELDSEDWLDAG
jgi:hypothetical protein